ncbi:potassium transporter TrkG [Pseudogemmobacter bohemicus]|uniref:potassium transporter TrkG n=1 Tax=Pseudogemmobacter bohemicus TaxID=2250708 RepID=UPI001E48F780|nr:potassium transporter TrkG [Pseudogemmobacter bohemicus]
MRPLAGLPRHGRRPLLWDVPLLVLSLGVVGVMCWIPAVHAASLRDFRTAQSFFYSGLILVVLTVMLGIVTRDPARRHSAHSQLAALAGTYAVLPFAFALPLAPLLRDTTMLNLWFEMISSFTTTGATGYAPDRLPPSVHLWRAMAGWLGGYFVLLAAWAVLAPLNLGGAEVISGQLPGQKSQLIGRAGAMTDPRERLTRASMAILPVYAGLTLALWLMLLVAGENGLIALTHAMGTLSTSGISAGNGRAVAQSGLAGEVLIFFFLLLALSRHLMPFDLPGQVRGSLRRDPEIRLGLSLIALVVTVLLLRHLVADAGTGGEASVAAVIRAFWGALFTAASFLTTTGYESVWWGSARNWAGMGSPGLMLMGLAIIGGGVATTAGGVTLLRVWALGLQGKRELDRIIHPHSIGSGAEARRLAGRGAWFAWIFFMLFAISVAVVTAALTLFGLRFTEALIFCLSALTTTGQLAWLAGDAPLSWSALTAPVKVILGLAMVLGRLETLALIALIAPGNWSVSLTAPWRQGKGR